MDHLLGVSHGTRAPDSASLCHSLCLKAVTFPPQEPADMEAGEPHHSSKKLLCFSGFILG